MTTDTKAVARWAYEASHVGNYFNDIEVRMTCKPDGDYILFTDHEQVVGELCSTMFAMNDKHFFDFNKIGELLKHRDRELAASRAEVEGFKKDAERYRWLRDRSGSSLTPAEKQPAAWIEGPGNEFVESDWLTGDRADHIIDAAMENGNVSP